MRKMIFILVILILSCNDAMLEYKWDCGCEWKDNYKTSITPDSPFSWTNDVPALRSSESAQKQMASLDMERIFREDMEDELHNVPPRFGYPHSVHYNLENSGEWITLPDGSRLWRLTISSPGALSINLLYDKFWIPDGAKFWIYSTDRRQLLDMLTSANNSGTRDDVQGFATGLLFSDEITLEYFVPSYVDDIGFISIVYVVHGYRNIRPPATATRTNWGGAESPNRRCLFNVNCAYGQSWRNERHAVALILVNGIRHCTGFLVNTTANDGRPLFMTAYHCLRRNDGVPFNTNLHHWSFMWNLESPTCADASPTRVVTTTGARLIAHNHGSDFALLNLSGVNSDPRYRVGITPYFLGWDRSGNSGVRGASIHHPNGQMKKINLFNQIEDHPYLTFWAGTPAGRPPFHIWPSALWRVTFNRGIIEGGSSGSPLMKENSRRVIGHAAGLSPRTQCCDTAEASGFIAYYGKFDVSWYGTPIQYGIPRTPHEDRQKRLGYWLAPGRETNAPLSVPGLLVGSPVTPPSISGPSAICPGAQPTTFTIHNLPENATVRWWTGNFLAIDGANNQHTVRVRTANSPTSMDSRVVADISLNGQFMHTVERVLVVNRPSVSSLTSSSGSQLHPFTSHFFTANHNGTSLTWNVTPSFGVQIWGSGNTRQISFTHSGSYTVSVTSTNACGSYTRSVHVNVIGNQFICQCWRVPCICLQPPPILLGEEKEEEEVENE